MHIPDIFKISFPKLKVNVYTLKSPTCWRFSQSRGAKTPNMPKKNFGSLLLAERFFGLRSRWHPAVGLVNKSGGISVSLPKHRTCATAATGYLRSAVRMRVLRGRDSAIATLPVLANCTGLPDLPAAEAGGAFAGPAAE